jgi:4-methylaminobutanoate oxidase (formaldehyde-forming)
VVNAVGQWALAWRRWRVDLPIIPRCTSTDHAARPGRASARRQVRDPENLVYVREEVGGYLVGGFEPYPKAWRLDGVPEFTQQLPPPNGA